MSLGDSLGDSVNLSELFGVWGGGALSEIDRIGFRNGIGQPIVHLGFVE
jgi:hypothetical protein